MGNLRLEIPQFSCIQIVNEEDKTWGIYLSTKKIKHGVFIEWWSIAFHI